MNDCEISFNTDDNQDENGRGVTQIIYKMVHFTKKTPEHPTENRQRQQH